MYNTARKLTTALSTFAVSSLHVCLPSIALLRPLRLWPAHRTCGDADQGRWSRTTLELGLRWGINTDLRVMLTKVGLCFNNPRAVRSKAQEYKIPVHEARGLKHLADGCLGTASCEPVLLAKRRSSQHPCWKAWCFLVVLDWVSHCLQKKNLV